MFRTVTFWLNFKCFHINGIFSKRTLFPGFGAFGLISSEGVSPKELKTVYNVAPIIHILASPSPNIA